LGGINVKTSAKAKVPRALLIIWDSFATRASIRANNGYTVLSRVSLCACFGDKILVGAG